MIAGSGLESFYRQRTAYSERPEYTPNISQDDFTIYDSPELAGAFCRDTDTGATESQLLIGGITCAACTWLLETELARVPGVERASVNLQQQRLDVVFNPSKLPVSAIFSRVQALGYRPQPFKASTQREQFERERKQSLRRVAVAGIGMMQVGMFGIALHAGDIQGISNEYQGLLRWVSLLVASFVVWYSARPFFESAWRHLRRGALVMDLPVSLAIGLALLASIWATLSGGGEVYFDSVVMFTFFLLLGRFLEQRVRLRQGMTWVDLEASLPDSVLVQRGGDWQRAVRSSLEPGELVLLRAGDTIAVDARVRDGESLVREDSFNGEQHPRSVSVGDTVYAGTVNIEQNMEAEVLCDFAQSRLATLQRSISQAQVNKPRLAQLADAIASYFVAGVLLVTSITALAWWQIQPDKALWVALSVLVIACPCALALATPAALAGAASGLRRMGIIVRGENSLEALASTTHLIFDKTGTLTRGDLSVGRVEDLAGRPEQDLLALAAALQQFSSHPVAAAFSNISPATGLTDALATAGAGVEASHQGSRLRMGSLAFCKDLQAAMPAPPNEPRYWVGLCSDTEPLAWIGLEDSVREEAAAVIRDLKGRGFELELLTGDASEAGPALQRNWVFSVSFTGPARKTRCVTCRPCSKAEPA